jgi:hypothetical protein
MRHFLALPVSLLPHRVHPSTASAPLVALARDPLAVASRAPRTRPPAVLRSRHVTRQAQRHHPAASRVPTDDDVQRDHGPLRCQARHPRGPVRPKTGRTATSRSGGAIEGTEGPASVSSLCASHARLHDGGAAGVAPHAAATSLTATATVMSFAAIVGSCRRGEWCSSPRSVVTTYAAINNAECVDRSCCSRQVVRLPS